MTKGDIRKSRHRGSLAITPIPDERDKYKLINRKQDVTPRTQKPNRWKGQDKVYREPVRLPCGNGKPVLARGETGRRRAVKNDLVR
ncbi:hypothetical protein J6590_071975 [Homalodisca vitripennis]|nr:hypothetical protein J6590_071975 [Homalodisca vitripennis]